MVSGQKIRKVRNVLQNRTAVSLLSIFMTCVAIFMMTGALYFRNEVTITDGNNTYKVYTTQTNPEKIISEQGITLTGLDYYSFNGFEGNTANLSITRSHMITITADGRSIELEAYTGETVGEILHRAGIELEHNDIVSHALYEKITGTAAINITRAFGITLRIEGVTLSIPVRPDGATTVGDILDREGIELGENDVVTANLNSVAYPGMQATVSTTRYIERVEEVFIPYETLEKCTKLLAIGAFEVVKEGTKGVEHVTFRDLVVDGEVIASEIVSTKVISPSTDKEMLVGRALAEPISKRVFPEIELVDGRPVNYEFMLSGRSTAYTASPTCGTASGRKLEVGTVAVDPNRIPYGSLLYIVTQDGRIVYGAAVAADTGGFIHNTDVVVDVYMGLTSTNIDDARNWGVKNVDVYVISTGNY
jgi:uncharacterized protein YabE (DUF348 family)/3D (Asp-Asp-Asp) domain-containing protein